MARDETGEDWDTKGDGPAELLPIIRPRDRRTRNRLLLILGVVIALAASVGVGVLVNRGPSADAASPGVSASAAYGAAAAQPSGGAASADPARTPEVGEALPSGRFYAYDGRVYVSAGGAIHLVRNETSLRLLAGGAPPEARALTAGEFAKLPAGEPVGIADAPELPAAAVGSVLFWRGTGSGRTYQALNNAAYAVDAETMNAICALLGRSPRATDHDDAYIGERTARRIKDGTLARRVDADGNVGRLYLPPVGSVTPYRMRPR